MEQQLYKASAQVADQILLEHLKKAHKDEAFVKQAIDRTRIDSPNPLVHKGWKEVSVLLSGGIRVVFKTSYLRKDSRGKRGRKRQKRGKDGSGPESVRSEKQKMPFAL